MLGKRSYVNDQPLRPGFGEGFDMRPYLIQAVEQLRLSDISRGEACGMKLCLALGKSCVKCCGVEWLWVPDRDQPGMIQPCSSEMTGKRCATLLGAGACEQRPTLGAEPAGQPIDMPPGTIGVHDRAASSNRGSIGASSRAALRW